MKFLFVGVEPKERLKKMMQDCDGGEINDAYVDRAIMESSNLIDTWETGLARLSTPNPVLVEDVQILSSMRNLLIGLKHTMSPQTPEDWKSFCRKLQSELSEVAQQYS